MKAAASETPPTSVRAKRRRLELRDTAEAAGRETYIDSNAPIARYFNATRTLLSQARAYYAEGRSVDAYVCYWRAVTFYVEHVSKHARYSHPSTRVMKKAIAQDVAHAMEMLEKLEPELQLVFEMEAESDEARRRAQSAAPGGAESVAASSALAAAPTPAAQGAPTQPQQPQLLPEVQAAMLAFVRPREAAAGSAAAGGACYPGLVVAHPPFSAPPPAASAPPWPPPSPWAADSAAAAIAVAALPPSGPGRLHPAPPSAVPPAPSAFAGSQALTIPPLAPPSCRPAGPGPPGPPGGGQQPAGPAGLGPPWQPSQPAGFVVPPLAPPQPQPYATAATAYPGPAAPAALSAPFCSPCAPPAAAWAASACPRPCHASAGTASLATPEFAPQRGSTAALRTLRLPRDLPARFLELARPNTLANVETCGILAGSFVRGELHVTHVLVPSQSGSSDACATTDAGEEDACMFHVERELITLGWIHTHPSQMCFFSSVDLHTQCGYQSMLDEAIGIVLAPQSAPSVGIFRLTTPAGLGEVQRCKESGFHPVHQRNGPGAGNGVYCESEHVVLSSELSVQLVDMRRPR